MRENPPGRPGSPAPEAAAREGPPVGAESGLAAVHRIDRVPVPVGPTRDPPPCADAPDSWQPIAPDGHQTMPGSPETETEGE